MQALRILPVNFASSRLSRLWGFRRFIFEPCAGTYGTILMDGAPVIMDIIQTSSTRSVKEG